MESLKNVWIISLFSYLDVYIHVDVEMLVYSMHIHSTQSSWFVFLDSVVNCLYMKIHVYGT